MAEVYVLTSIESADVWEIKGVFTDLEQAKTFMLPKYDQLRAWVQCENGCWHSDTGKHPMIIEKTLLDPVWGNQPPSPAEVRE